MNRPFKPRWNQAIRIGCPYCGAPNSITMRYKLLNSTTAANDQTWLKTCNNCNKEFIEFTTEEI